MLKQLLGNPVVQFLIGRSIGLYMLLVGVTTRWQRVNADAMAATWSGKTSMICCIWHGRFLLIHKMWRFSRATPKPMMLISRSREGGIVAHASQTVGADVIRGSAPKGRQSKGGPEAMRAMARQLEGAGAMGMTPDGPRGPRMRAKKAPVQLAKLAQAPLVALAWSTNHRVVLGSWDRLIFPLPFGKGALIWSDPIAPPSPDADDAEIEAVRAKLEQELNRICAEADRLAGVSVIEPAPFRVMSTVEPESAA